MRRLLLVGDLLLIIAAKLIEWLVPTGQEPACSLRLCHHVDV